MDYLYPMEELDIIFEDNKLLVVNKPSGLITERSPFESQTVESAVYRYLSSTRKNPFLGVIHRLDRVTSGVLMFAKNKSTLVAMNRIFEQRRIQKTYLAITTNPPKEPSGMLQHELVIDRKQKKALVHHEKQPGSKSAVLSYRVLSTADGATLIEVHPKTGRFHQIRAQLAHIGCPIVGDTHYGSTTAYEDRKIGLHAQRLILKDSNLDFPQEFHAAPPSEGVWAQFQELFL